MVVNTDMFLTLLTILFYLICTNNKENGMAVAVTEYIGKLFTNMMAPSFLLLIQVLGTTPPPQREMITTRDGRFYRF